MNDTLRARLAAHLEAAHDAVDGDDLPAYQRQYALPRWLDQWPDFSPARQRLEDARQARDWGPDDD